MTGRKSDVEDCQWLQQLHSYGLLQGSFRPQEKILPLRAYTRQRSMLIEHMALHIQHMQKALFQMNLQLSNVLSDIAGATGMKIIRAIIDGQRDSKKLAQLRDYRCSKSQQEIERSLTGTWREEHLFSLRQALESYDFYQKQLLSCDEKIEQALHVLNGGTPSSPDGRSSQDKKPRSYKPKKGNSLYFDVNTYLEALTGIDLTKIPGIDGNTALKLIGEIGLDMSYWKTAQHFSSWLGLSPENKVSGGKRLSSKTKPTANRASQILRVAAGTLHHSQSSLGGFLRRLKFRLGAPKAITATAHKLAVIIYSMLKNGTQYVEIGLEAYERSYQEHLIKTLKKKASQLGFSLVPSLEKPDILLSKNAANQRLNVCGLQP